MGLVILVDLDGPVADFEDGVRRALLAGGHPTVPAAERKSFHVADDYETRFGVDGRRWVLDAISVPGFYRRLAVVAGAVEGLTRLRSRAEVFLCTSPLLLNPTCASDKLAWVAEHLGDEWVTRTIITRDKTAVHGDYLIDDRPDVNGRLMPTWQQVLFLAPYNRHAETARCVSGWGDLGESREWAGWEHK